MADTDNKLWVFDTWHFVEIYAPDLEDAERQANKFAEETGVDLRLVDNWKEYQDGHAEKRGITNA